MQDQDLALLVDKIANRVRERLATQPSCVTSAGGTACQGGVSVCEHCGGCTLSAETLATAGADRIGGKLGAEVLPAALAGYIDHTLLKADATKDEVIKLCEEARKHHMASVCVNTGYIRLAKGCLEGAQVKVVAVVGFPLGAMAPAAKAFEAREAVRQGAEEIDMVLNIGALRSGDVSAVYEDIRKVVEAAKPAPVKVILETSMLDDEQKVVGSVLSKLAGAAFVKTSTGFGGGGATVEDVALMRRVVGPDLGVKASGGIRNTEDVTKMIKAGATRIGASASVAIVTGQKPAASKGY